MNALDFLADFAALVSTSEASRPGYYGNNIDQSANLERRNVDSASEMCVPPLEGLSPVNGERPIETVQLQSSTAPSLLQQTFPTHVVNHPTSNTQYHGPCKEFFMVPADPYACQSFNQFLYLHPGLGLPCASSDEMSYLGCDCERLAQWGPSSEVNYSLQAEPRPWIYVQPQPHPPHHDIQFLETQFVLPAEELSMQPSQCMDATCHCPYPQPSHQAVSNNYVPPLTRHVWGPHTSVYDRDISKEDNEWMWMNARGLSEMSYF